MGSAAAVSPSRSLPAFLLLYGALYSAFGAESPFLPSFLSERGLSPQEIGVALAAGTFVRLVAGPIVGWIADRYEAKRLALGLCAASAGVLSIGYLAGHRFASLLAIGMIHAAALAALPPLADTLALAAADRGKSFAYGWVRGAGSAAFILGTLLSGQLVPIAGLNSIIVSSGILFLALAFAAAHVPSTAGDAAQPTMRLEDIRSLIANRTFQRLVVVGCLVIGSHALNDSFAVIRWRAAGIDPAMVSVLWSLSVVSEVVMFIVIGPWLLKRLGPGVAAALSATVGVLRWGVMAQATAVPILAVIQLSHGFTFALLHLVNMGLIVRTVPERLAATAQTLYGTFGLGLASIVFTLASSALFDRFGASAFWAMAALCAVAAPLALPLKEPDDAGDRPR